MGKLLFGILAIVCLAALGGQWISPMSYEMSAALGRNGASGVNKFGSSLDANTDEATVWDGNGAAYGGPDRAFANQVGPFTLYASSDAADTMGLEVQGLDASGDEQTVTITLTGTTVVPVGVGAIWSRVFRAKPDADLTGVVYLHLDATPTAGVPDTPATDIVAIVTPSEGQTMMNAYSVANKHSFMLSVWCMSNTGSPTASTKTFRLRTTYPAGTASRTQRSMEYADGDGGCLPISPPLRFRAGADIELTVESASSTGTQPVTGNFDGILIPD